MWSAEGCRIPILFFGLGDSTVGVRSLSPCLGFISSSSLVIFFASFSATCPRLAFFDADSCCSLLSAEVCFPAFGQLKETKSKAPPPPPPHSITGSIEDLCLTFFPAPPGRTRRSLQVNTAALSSSFPVREVCSSFMWTLLGLVHLTVWKHFFKHCCPVTHPLPAGILCRVAHVKVFDTVAVWKQVWL